MTRQHSSRMRTAWLPAAHFSGHHWMSVLAAGRAGLGSQVKKFEQVSSDDHQMSVAGGNGVGSRSDWAGGTLPCDLSHDAPQPPPTD